MNRSQKVILAVCVVAIYSALAFVYWKKRSDPFGNICQRDLVYFMAQLDKDSVPESLRSQRKEICGCMRNNLDITAPGKEAVQAVIAKDSWLVTAGEETYRAIMLESIKACSPLKAE